MATAFASILPMLIKMLASQKHGGGGGGGEGASGEQVFNSINNQATSFPGPPDEIGDIATNATTAMSAQTDMPAGQPGLESLFGPANPYSSAPAGGTNDPFRFIKMALALSAGSRSRRSAESAAGALQFINALQALNKPQKEGDQFQQAIQALLGNTRRGGQTVLPTFPSPPTPSSPAPSVPEPSVQSFPGPPNEVGDGQGEPIVIPRGVGLIQPNPATRGAQNAGLPSGLTQDQMRMALQATAMINQGQQLQKLVGAKELQPTLIEAFMSGKGMAPGLAYKQEARQHLRLVQLAAINNLINSGQGHLAEAFFRTMSPEEQSNLAHQHMSMLTAATALQRAQAQPYLNTFGPVSTGEQALEPGALNPALALPGQGGQPGAPIAYPPGEQRPGQPSFSPGTAGAALTATGQRQATLLEAQNRFDLALQDPKQAASMAVAYGASTGQPVKPETLQQEMQRNLQLRGYNMMEPALQRSIQKMQAGQQGTATAAPPPAGPPPIPGVPLPRHRQDLEDAADAQAQAHGIPASFIKGLIDVENNAWNPRVNNARFGPHGGMGLMQIVPRTWEGLKAKVGPGADPHDGKHSIIAGTAYITELQQKYGDDWPRIAAAYQAGPGNIPTQGPIPKTVTVQGPQGSVTIHPADYSDKVMGAMQARSQGQAQPTWTQPGAVPAGQLDQARAAGQAPPSPSGQPPGQAQGQGEFDPLLGFSMDIGGMKFNPAEAMQRSAPSMFADALSRGGIERGLQAAQQLPFQQGERQVAYNQLSVLSYLAARSQLEQQHPVMDEPTLHATASRQAAQRLGGAFNEASVAGLVNKKGLAEAVKETETWIGGVTQKRLETGQPRQGGIPETELAQRQREIDQKQAYALAAAQSQGRQTLTDQDIRAGEQAYAAEQALLHLKDQWLAASTAGSGPIRSFFAAGQHLATRFNFATETGKYEDLRKETIRVLSQLGGEGERMSPQITAQIDAALPDISTPLDRANAAFDNAMIIAKSNFIGRGGVTRPGQPLTPPPQGQAQPPTSTSTPEHDAAYRAQQRAAREKIMLGH